jgi:hypothetical protein
MTRQQLLLPQPKGVSDIQQCLKYRRDPSTAAVAVAQWQPYCSTGASSVPFHPQNYHSHFAMHHSKRHTEGQQNGRYRERLPFAVFLNKRNLQLTVLHSCSPSLHNELKRFLQPHPLTELYFTKSQTKVQTRRLRCNNTLTPSDVSSKTLSTQQQQQQQQPNFQIRCKAVADL